MFGGQTATGNFHEGIPDILTDFITAWTDSRPEGRQIIPGIRSCEQFKGYDGLSGKPFRKTSPPAVNCRDCSCCRVHYQYGKTVGSSDADKNTRDPGQKGVTLGEAILFLRQWLLEGDNSVTMNLPDRVKRVRNLVGY